MSPQAEVSSKYHISAYILSHSPDDSRYLFNVAYGVGKAGCDRMAADCGHELRKSGVAMISLWPGPVKTEYITDKMNDGNPMAKLFEKGETIEFAGIVLAHLAAESGETIMARSGRIINTADVAKQYGFKDIDGTVPVDFRRVTLALEITFNCH